MCTASTSINTLLGCVRRRGWGVDQTARRPQSAPACVLACWCQVVARLTEKQGTLLQVCSADSTAVVFGALQVGGPGGLLRVILVNASNLCFPGQQQQQTLPAAAGASSPDARRASKKGSSKSAAVSTSGDAAKLSAYCEVTFGPTVLRTPITHLAGTALADWSYQFSLALPFELDAWPAAQAAGAGGGGSSGRGVAAGGAAGHGSAGPQRASAAGSDATDPNLYLSVFDAQTVGQPVLLGKTKVRACASAIMYKRQHVQGQACAHAPHVELPTGCEQSAVRRGCACAKLELCL